MLNHMKIILLSCLLFLCSSLSANTANTDWANPQGGDFTLKTTSGMLKTQDLRGKTLLIFFGFLHCPAICPTTIRELNRVAKELPADVKKNVQMIFVTVDPERDTPEKLKARFAQLDPMFIPAYGTHEEIRKAIKLFGGDFKVEKPKSPTDGTSVDHNSNIFVVSPRGIWVNSLAYNTKAQTIRDAIYLAPSQLPYYSEEAKIERLHRLGANTECDLSRKDCEFITDNGIKYQVQVGPRPVKHLRKTRITVSIKNEDFTLTPKVADIIGEELVMGLIRPKLEKVSDRKWSGEFTLPTCDLRTMHFFVRLLLQDKTQENYEIRYRFSSINPAWDPRKKRIGH